MTFRILLVIGLLLAVASACAADIAVARSDTTVVTLTDERAGCDWASGAKRVRILIEGKEHLGCYVVVDKAVYILWDDGDRGTAATSAFRPTT
jgi:hypothetical protein